MSITGRGVGGWEMQGGDRDEGLWDWDAVGMGMQDGVHRLEMWKEWEMHNG